MVNGVDLSTDVLLNGVMYLTDVLRIIDDGVARATVIIPYHKGLINGSRYLQDVLLNGFNRLKV